MEYVVPRTWSLLVNAVVFPKGTKPPQPLNPELNVHWQLVHVKKDMDGSYLKCLIGITEQGHSLAVGEQ